MGLTVLLISDLATETNFNGGLSKDASAAHDFGFWLKGDSSICLYCHVKKRSPGFENDIGGQAFAIR